MLAQNFITADVLGITNAEHEGLVKVLGMLERGEIPAESFNMATFRVKMSCGTVGCLLGWANIVSDGAAFSELSHICPASHFEARLSSEALALFCIGPHDRFRHIFNKATPELGASALRNFLTLGEARWDEVLA